MISCSRIGGVATSKVAKIMLIAHEQAPSVMATVESARPDRVGRKLALVAYLATGAFFASH